MAKNLIEASQFQNLQQAVDDPLFFVEKIIGATPQSYQSEIIKAVELNNKVAWRAGHGVGKTALASWIALWFLFTRPEAKVITTASNWRQVSKMLWAEIGHWLHQADLRKTGDWEFEKLDTMIKISDDWFATGEASDRASNLEGFHAPHLLYIVDEGKAVPNETYESIEGAMTGENAKMLVISTPPPQKSGYFYDIFSGKVQGFQKFHTSCLDSPLVDRAWIEARKKEWGEGSPMYQTRVLGEFAESSQDSLIMLAWIEAAVDKQIEQSETEPLEIGIDCARFGEDKTAFVIRQGAFVRMIESHGGWDTMQTAGRAVELIRRYNPKLVKVDVIGLGAGVVDRLKEQGFEQVVGVNVAQSATDKERFKNLRAELWWGLRERFQEGNISIEDHEELIAQLSNIRFKLTSAGQYQIEEKDELKKRGFHSPDEADALVLAFAPVQENKFEYAFI